VLSRGNVEVGKALECLIVSGGDVTCKGRLGGCMILAAGDVQLNTRGGVASSRALIIAGGIISLKDGASELLVFRRKKCGWQMALALDGS